MLTLSPEPAVIPEDQAFNTYACSMLCSAVFDSERFWQEDNAICLPAVNDPVSDIIVSTLDELMFPFCPGEGDVLITRNNLPAAQVDYLRSLGFCFENVLAGAAEQERRQKPDGNRSYLHSPYSVLPAWKEKLAGWNVINDLPSLQVVKKVNSKIFSWQLRSELAGNLGNVCFSSSDVRSAAGKILLQGKKAILKEAFGVSGRGSIVIDNEKILDRICGYIYSREKKGGKAEFVIEPLLNKTMDFSCHFIADRNTGVTMLGLQRMKNSGFAFSKVESAECELEQLLDKNGYFSTVETVAHAIMDEGYSGPVCLDSMITADGIVPIVEINARKSMGLVNIMLHARIKNPAKRCVLGFYDMHVPHDFSHQNLLEYLDKKHILFNGERGYGIVVLNSNGITAHRNAILDGSMTFSTARKRYMGRIYYAIISDTSDSGMLLEKKFRGALSGLSLNTDC
jgi:hypothetical protein